MSTRKPDPVQHAAQTIADGCLAGRVRFLNRSLTSIYDEAFRPLGVTAGQISVLVVLVKRGSAAPVEIGRTLNIEKSTLSRNLERMRKAGWVTVTPEGRSQSITTTAKGRKILQEALPLWKDAQKATRKLLGAEGADDLKEVADHLQNQLASP